jgi:uncharacterized protein YlbG (UPF0298 family)
MYFNRGSFSSIASQKKFHNCTRQDIMLVWLDEFAKSQEIMPHMNGKIQFGFGSKKAVYKMYISDPDMDELEKLSEKHFIKVWRAERKNYIIRKYFQLAKCDTCEYIRAMHQETHDDKVLTYSPH